MINIHYDVDGVLRDFHTAAFNLFFTKYPKYKHYTLPVDQIRGWYWIDHLKVIPGAGDVSALMDEEIFNNEEMCYRAFYEAKPLVSTKEWLDHIDKIEKVSADVEMNITISTHQYNNISRLATLNWLSKYNFMDGDKINLLFTGKKEQCGADFLLDDKVETIKTLNETKTSIGVLKLNEYSNSWYIKQHKHITFPTAKTLDDFYLIIKKNILNFILI